MLDAHIYNEMNRNFVHTPTKDQEKAMKILSHFTVAGDQLEVLLLKGFAGTGKTSIISAYIRTLKALKQNFVLLAPTGRAAKVLSAYSGESAFTIHKEIYRQKSLSDAFGSFDLNFNKHKDAVFIVDEASMISNTSSDNSQFGSGRVLDDLMQYVFTGTRCRIIFVGDNAQLPPVGTALSPALDKNVIEQYGFQLTEILLKDVVRQALASGILSLATFLRNRIESEKTGYPELNIEGFKDVEKISGEDLIERLAQSYDKKGLEDTLVITRSNKRSNKYNQGIRASVLYKEEALSAGDMIMVVKNNYLWADKEAQIGFIANGDIVQVQRVRGHQELYDLHFTDVSLLFNGLQTLELDVKIIDESILAEGPALDYKLQKEFYYKVLEDYMHITRKPERTKKMKTDLYYNALQVKFAYAVTCHKAQGGQWKDVYIDLGYVTEEMLTVEYLQWLYTAVTRASEHVYLVNFPETFFAG